MLKKIPIRYIISASILIIVCIIFFIQLANWQLVNGALYREIADKDKSNKINVTAARGEILDRNGVDLAINITGYDITFNKYFFEPGTENDIILTLVNLFKSKNQEWINEIPITIDDNGNYAFLPDRDKDISSLKNAYRLNSYTTPEECVNTMASKKWYDCSDYTNEDKLNILSVRYNMNKSGYNYETEYTFATNVSQEIVAIISENSQKIKGVQIKTTPIRKYVNGELAPHIVGSVGAISPDEYNELKQTGNYKLNSILGKSGIEKVFEDTLRGKDGKEYVNSDDYNNTEYNNDEQPISGDTVYLTIDARLQKIAKEALETNVNNAKKGAKGDYVSGSVVMLDVKDFSVLCAQSYPSYNLTEYVENKDYYNSLVKDEVNRPLFFRAFEGTYPIGSSMKPAVALAALQEGIIDPDTTYNCNRTYTRFSPSYSPKCLGKHGSINLERALAVSCNIYFFETGFHLGITDMNIYQTRLGLGQKTGVEIPERVGVLAGPAEREVAGGTWYDGDTIAAAIGQSDNLITPLQLATYCATIANNGTRLSTHVVSKTTDYSRQTEKSVYDPQIKDTLQVSPENLKIVQEDMRKVVTRSDGTAHKSFGSYGVAVAAKTGTAEVNKTGTNISATDNVTLIAYAPFEDPQVAIGIILEHGGSGTYCANIAKALLDGYFNGINMDNIPKTNVDGTVD